jgi:hypothetical protein
MTDRHPQDTEALLRVLSDGGVDFVIVDGVAAVLHGSGRVTADLDVAGVFSEEALSKLVAALEPHDPRHATRPELRLVDEPLSRLATFRLLLIETTLGRLDVIKNVEPVGEIPDLEVIEMEIADRRCSVVGLDQLIRIKRHLNRPKDVEVAVELEAIRERRR